MDANLRWFPACRIFLVHRRALGRSQRCSLSVARRGRREAIPLSAVASAGATSENNGTSLSSLGPPPPSQLPEGDLRTCRTMWPQKNNTPCGQIWKSGPQHNSVKRPRQSEPPNFVYKSPVASASLPPTTTFTLAKSPIYLDKPIILMSDHKSATQTRDEFTHRLLHLSSQLQTLAESAPNDLPTFTSTLLKSVLLHLPHTEQDIFQST